MTPTQLKSAREKLGLSIGQMAAVMDTDERSWRRFEKGDRPPAARVIRLLEAYIAEYRPNDWPNGQGFPRP